MKRISIALVIMVLLASLVLAKMTSYDESGGKIGYDVEIQLYEGWNLIPAVCNSGIDDIKAANIRTMYVLNPNTLQYLNVYHNGQFRNEDELGPIEEQVCGSPWWVHVSESNLFKYRPDHLPKLEDKQIYKGWNFLIVTPEMANKNNVPVSEQFEIKDFVGSCNIEKSFVFDPDEQQWIEFPLTEEFYEVTTGFGWVIRVSENCKMSPVDETTDGPPPIPT